MEGYQSRSARALGGLVSVDGRKAGPLGDYRAGRTVGRGVKGVPV